MEYRRRQKKTEGLEDHWEYKALKGSNPIDQANKNADAAMRNAIGDEARRRKRK